MIYDLNVQKILFNYYMKYVRKQIFGKSAVSHSGRQHHHHPFTHNILFQQHEFDSKKYSHPTITTNGHICSQSFKTIPKKGYISDLGDGPYAAQLVC